MEENIAFEPIDDNPVSTEELDYIMETEDDFPTVTSGFDGYDAEVTDYLYIRIGPGTEYDKLEVLKPGDVVHIVEEAEIDDLVWCRISDDRGWCLGRYLEKKFN